MERQRGTNAHTMFGTLGEVRQGRQAMRVGRDQIKEAFTPCYGIWGVNSRKQIKHHFRALKQD